MNEKFFEIQAIDCHGLRCDAARLNCGRFYRIVWPGDVTALELQRFLNSWTEMVSSIIPSEVRCLSTSTLEITMRARPWWRREPTVAEAVGSFLRAVGCTESIAYVLEAVARVEKLEEKCGRLSANNRVAVSFAAASCCADVILLDSTGMDRVGREAVRRSAEEFLGSRCRIVIDVGSPYWVKGSREVEPYEGGIGVFRSR